MTLFVYTLVPILGAILIWTREKTNFLKSKVLATQMLGLSFIISCVSYGLFDYSLNYFQLIDLEIQPVYGLRYGLDGLSLYFAILIAIVTPIAFISNWNSIVSNIKLFTLIILLLEHLLLAVFLSLDMLLFYIFFESILPPLFLLVGMFGSDNRIKASFYLFLYTLAGSLFLLLAIVHMFNIMNLSDYDNLFRSNFVYNTQLLLFYGIFLAFAVKTPTMFLNTWLLKAHVESPLSGSILLAAVVLKLSLYGILRLILPLLPKAYMSYTYLIFLIGVITILYASLSTIRTIDVKELIAYSSVCHAAVYLLSLFSNSIQGIEGAISLGLAHGLVSPALFICAGGILYDRFHTRVITVYRGMTQVMPLFALLFFLFCLANCGAPLSFNFVGEFLSLYGVLERSFFFGILASSSIVFSAAYTMYMYQKIAFGGSYSSMFTKNVPDLTYREFSLLLILIVPTILFGIYPAPILDGMHYSVSTLLYCFDNTTISCSGQNVSTLFAENMAFIPLFSVCSIKNTIGKLNMFTTYSCDDSTSDSTIMPKLDSSVVDYFNKYLSQCTNIRDGYIQPSHNSDLNTNIFDFTGFGLEQTFVVFSLYTLFSVIVILVTYLAFQSLHVIEPNLIEHNKDLDSPCKCIHVIEPNLVQHDKDLDLSFTKTREEGEKPVWGTDEGAVYPVDPLWVPKPIGPRGRVLSKPVKIDNTMDERKLPIPRDQWPWCNHPVLFRKQYTDRDFNTAFYFKCSGGNRAVVAPGHEKGWSCKVCLTVICGFQNCSCKKTL